MILLVFLALITASIAALTLAPSVGHILQVNTVRAPSKDESASPVRH